MDNEDLIAISAGAGRIAFQGFVNRLDELQCSDEQRQAALIAFRESFNHVAESHANAISIGVPPPANSG